MCKSSLLYKNDKNFWVKKFKHDKLPILCYVYFQVYPIYWITEYIKCDNVKNKVNKLWQVTTYNNFTTFYTCSVIVTLKINDNLQFLPTDFYNAIINNSIADDLHSARLHISLYLHLGDINYVGLDEDEEELFYISTKIDPLTVKAFLTKLVYYLPHAPLEIL
jgi:hypothetical protein